MKAIVAFVHPARASQVVQKLEQTGLYHLSLSRAHVVVQPDAPIERPQLAPEGDPEVRLEAYCADDQVESVLALIRQAGHVGDLPSGAVFVHAVEQSTPLRQAGPR
jgi:nitrogen regulatory protein P-II 1